VISYVTKFYVSWLSAINKGVTRASMIYNDTMDFVPRPTVGRQTSALSRSGCISYRGTATDWTECVVIQVVGKEWRGRAR